MPLNRRWFMKAGLAGIATAVSLPVWSAPRTARANTQRRQLWLYRVGSVPDMVFILKFRIHID